MDHTSFMQDWHHRAAQFLSRVIGFVQTQHQSFHADRHQSDGFLRSGDDPDARQRQLWEQHQRFSHHQQQQGVWGHGR